MKYAYRCRRCTHEKVVEQPMDAADAPLELLTHQTHRLNGTDATQFCGASVLYRVWDTTQANVGPQPHHGPGNPYTPWEATAKSTELY